MPEGPEVRTVADKLRPYLVSNILLNIHLGSRARIKGNDKLTYPTSIFSVQSYGKKLIIEIENYIIIFSLGMTGRFQYVAGNHSHIILEIRSKDKVYNLYFDDQRYMGNVLIISLNDVNSYFSKLGPDLLSSVIDRDQWLSIFKIRRNMNKQIHKILVDQSLVSGIGHYLMTEILYYCGISPRRLGKNISDEEWELLRIVSHNLIYVSYSYGGLTIKDYISPDGETGIFPAVIYGNKSSTDPLGNPIIHEKADNSKGSRTLHWVPNVQI